MASGFGPTYANPQLDHIFRAQTAPTYPTALWVAAFTASNASSFLAVNDMVSATEVSTTGTAYARIAIMGATGIDFSAAASSQIVTSSDIVWSAATASWGTVYAIALVTASSGGNVLAYGDLTTPRAVTIPDILRIPAGQLIIGL